MHLQFDGADRDFPTNRTLEIYSKSRKSVEDPVGPQKESGQKIRKELHKWVDNDVKKSKIINMDKEIKNKLKLIKI